MGLGGGRYGLDARRPAPMGTNRGHRNASHPGDTTSARTVHTQGVPGGGYGLGLFKINGWVGHNGALPGYQSVTMYLPSKRATMVILINTDINYKNNEPSTFVARAITRIISPRHVYYLPPPAQS